MKNILLLFLCTVLCKNAEAQVFPVSDIMQNGPDSNRINLAVVAEGYTSTQQSKFLSDATITSTGLFAISPLKEYANFFNVYAIQVPSVDSGADHPGTALDLDVSSPWTPVENVNSYFDCTYDYGNMHRGLAIYGTAGYNKLWAVLAANVPWTDEVLMLVNSPYYGGTGNPRVAIVSMLSILTKTVTPPVPIPPPMYSAIASTAAHEFGHSFVKLGDEYNNPYTITGVNISKTSDTNLVEWKSWLHSQGVEVYPQSSNNLFRPRLDSCKMYGGWQDFCPVCKDGYITAIYKVVSPIDSTTPDTTTTLTYSGSPLTFKLKLVRPNPNTLKIQWRLNGTLLSAKDTIVQITSAQLQTGQNKLTAFVTDTTMLSRSYWPGKGFQFSTSWKINKSGTSINILNSSEASKFIHNVFPNPATDKLFLGYENLTPDSEVRYSILAIDGRVVLSGTLELKRGKQLTALNISTLQTGIYSCVFDGEHIHINSRFVKQ
ncbi:MAG: M64 family metallopeptidase [Flavipsychrobacter sp.]